MHQLEIYKLICLHCVSICNTCSIMQANTPLSAETPTKSSGNTDQGLMKKLKGFDGLAMSIGNGDAENAEGGSRVPQRFESGTNSTSSEFSFSLAYLFFFVWVTNLVIFETFS